MIVVTGATGGLGAAVVKNLLQLVPSTEIAVSVREPEQAQSLAKRGIDVRHGDYDRPDTLERAFEAVDRLLLISASGIEHERRVTQHRNAIQAAQRANVKHVYYTSLVRGRDSVAYVMQAHIDTERLLEESGLRYTILQNGVYAEAVDTYLGAYARGEIVVPADGPVAWVSRTDLAAGTALLLRDGGHHAETLRLTGSATRTIHELAEVLSAALGRRIQVRVVSIDEYVRYQISLGKPAEHAKHWATTYLAIARGELAAVDPLLEQLLGRPLRSVEEVMTQIASESQSGS